MNNSLLYFLDKSREFLEKKGIPSARLDAEIILADILGMERIKLYSKFDMPLSPAEQDLYRNKIKERSTFKPVSYITGKKYFYNDEFTVNDSVLIPRPETEELVEWVLAENRDHEISVLDLCSGSGCIAVTLKKERPLWQLTLSDISPTAIETAKTNIQNILNGAVISMVESDLFASFPGNETFDIIVTNPPYIPLAEKETIMKDVLFEPDIALFIENQTDFFQKLFSGARRFLKPDGALYMEIHQDASELMRRISLEAGFADFSVKNDLSGKERFIRVTKK